ncbi:MAG: zinc finger domain-containing protein [Candidatus Thermoplasmatota archaeon]|nr:zinc finger domain-containing protein [Candidatus Thermoplasmatota archaeon]MCL5983096.1 zinc finger domain-containing protein [Candidatus Thermoplasmatota archaeon]
MTEARATSCTSCGASLSVRGSTQFPCPNCGQVTIGRDPRCRDQSVLYHCSSCGFEGP